MDSQFEHNKTSNGEHEVTSKAVGQTELPRMTSSKVEVRMLWECMGSTAGINPTQDRKDSRFCSHGFKAMVCRYFICFYFCYESVDPLKSWPQIRTHWFPSQSFASNGNKHLRQSTQTFHKEIRNLVDWTPRHILLKHQTSEGMTGCIGVVFIGGNWAIPKRCFLFLPSLVFHLCCETPKAFDLGLRCVESHRCSCQRPRDWAWSVDQT